MGIAPEAIAFWTEPLGMYLMATLVNVFAFLLIALGLKAYFKVQKIFVVWGLIGVIMAAVILTVTPSSTFVNIWNNYAAETGSLTYAQTITAVDTAMEGIPATWNLTATLHALLPFSWISIYGYVIAFIGGEVKNPRRNIMIGQVLNLIVVTLLMTWVTGAILNLGGNELMYAQSYIDYEGGVALAGVGEYAFPFSTTYINLASMITGFERITGFIMGMSFILMDFLWIPFSYIAFSRGLLAWGMDRLGPMWFTDVNLKLGSPLKLLIVLLVLSQVAMTHYVLYPDVLGAFTVELMQLLSVFGVTAIACMIFPYVKKVRNIWDVSPYKGWRIIGMPVATIVGFLTLVFVGILVWASYYPELLTDLIVSWSWVYVVVWIAGFAWYFGWKSYRARQGIDITLAFKELAPE